MDLLDRIEKHLKDHHISATRFGRRAAGDPRFVLDLRNGRRPRRRTLERLETYLNSFDQTDEEIAPMTAPCARQAHENAGQPRAKAARRLARPSASDVRSSLR
ncbi:hypothetical protein E3U23_12005 [Erythrobacter litoralis]|nr:hypothetical protein [Erythrobacter litoralis]